MEESEHEVEIVSDTVPFAKEISPSDSSQSTKYESPERRDIITLGKNTFQYVLFQCYKTLKYLMCLFSFWIINYFLFSFNNLTIYFISHN